MNWKDLASSSAALASLLGASVFAPTAHALVFDYGDLKVTFDTTLSVGGIYRLNNPDPAYYGLANGGEQLSVNADDGELNYKRGIASSVFKGTHELELKYHDFGAFVRGSYFYDWENQKGDRARTPLSQEAKDWVGKRAEFLDVYARGTFDIAGRPLDVRFGRQVLNLGESTFIPNGINVVNAVDVSRLRVPGAELREAFLPVNMLKGSLAVADNVTVEAFWLLEFRKTEIDPAGYFFSTNDFAARGGKNVYLGFGSLSDQQPLGAIPRDADHRPNNYTQYGADVRVTVPSLGDTEFGLYFANYHSRLPVISSRTPMVPVNTNLTGPLTQVFSRSSVPSGVTPAQFAASIWQLIVLSQTNPSAMTPTQVATLQNPQIQAAINGAKQIALLSAASTGRYFLEYPDDIQMLGASFNTSIGNVAWQGEVSYKHDVPLQVDDVELLFATMSALSPTFGSPNNQIGSFLGQYAKYIPGYRRRDVWTGQTTLSRVFGPMLGAGQFTVVGEIGGVYADLPDKSVLRFDGPGTFTSGSQAAMNATTSAGGTPLPATPAGAFADDFSWGYQLIGRLEYNNLFAGVNFLPAVGFSHDVSGNTPLPLGNFLEGRKSINVVAEFTWQNAWSFEVRYVNYFGGGRYNLLGNRDYVASTLKYSF
ncbi:hypothetical protein DB347_15560 [Opitutaceae bacterium EW11]|nr:hypothetical protein DB347_15560 [Opitutaceae bacterium EW11]